MGISPKSGLKKICPVPPDVILSAYYTYLDECTELGRAPSLPDYLSRLNRLNRTCLTEVHIATIIGRDDAEGINTYSDTADAWRAVLLGLRGEYLSNPLWSGAMASKASLALSKDYGDGVRYSSKRDEKSGVERLSISFGDAGFAESAAQ